MKYNIPAHVQFIIDNLKWQVIDATLIGGALRAAALGGDVADYDLAIFGTRDEWYQYTGILQELGFQECHHDLYGDNEGYIGDWRLNDINVIMYDQSKVFDVQELIGCFDLNINQWYIGEDGELENDFWYEDTKLVEINPYRDGLGHMERLTQRILRFKEQLPQLDWSAIDKRRKVTVFLDTEIVTYE